MTAPSPSSSDLHPDTPHPLGCAVFGCTERAARGVGVTKDDPGLWVCHSSLHRAWAIGFLEARSAAKPSSHAAAPEPPALTQAPATTLFQAAARENTRQRSRQKVRAA